MRDEVVVSPETSLRYRVDRLLGEGGFGQVYLSKRLGRSPLAPDVLCIKVSTRIDGWLREAHFGQLLARAPARHPGLRSLPAAARPTARCSTAWRSNTRVTATSARTCITTGKGFTEAAARREIAGILEVLGKLHRGQMLHRDLTPLNVFVCEGRKLKLGDFGIARPQTDRRGVTARTLNPFAAPSDILAGTAPKWQARDDVYQVGQLLGMLIKGDARDACPHGRDPTPGLQRSPEGDHSPLHRRAAEAVRERRPPDRRVAQPAGGAQGRRRAIAARRAPVLHRHPRAGRAARPWPPPPAPARSCTAALDQDDGRGARASERAAGRGQGRRAEADGDPAAARRRASHHAGDRGAVLAARRRKR